MKRKSGNMVRRIIVMASVLALLMAACVGVIGYSHIQKAYFTSFKEGLHASAILMEDEISHEWGGDWSVTEYGVLRKGTNMIHDVYQKQLDELHEQTGMHYTVFYGDTRYITTLTDPETGERMEGTTASESVVNEVLVNGNEYLATDLEIAGQKWYAYYLPLRNSDGTVAGMIFVGRDTTEIVGNLKKAGLAIIGTFVVFFLFNFAVARILISKTSKAIGDIVGGLHNLENGELDFYIKDSTFKRSDELGVIAESSAQVRDKLQDVISVAKKLSVDVTDSGVSLANSAASASRVAEQVTNAVEDISRGAVSQAENVETSVNNTNEMGDSIDDITEKIEELSAVANEMRSGAQRTVDTLNNLMEKNEDVMNSMQDINAQIRLTNDSVQDIAEASNIITSIAKQTNLLSLNATIEAARAGEYGKGFTVVASEIGALATQSKDSAETIKKIVDRLVKESKKSVDTIEQLGESMKEQNNQLTSTKGDMDAVVLNVNSVDNSTKTIADKIKLLNNLKVDFSDIISELSAISQQNAASTQETNASMEELNATFALISNAANELRDMAENLNEKMSFFTFEVANEETNA
ncbi:MAG: methyl-accepting chemotaxis protein [Acetatifactor sp.]|nr:methyl-accepting chemotaxis protein [Acetatifactor sp.]